MKNLNQIESEILNTFNRKIVPFKPGKWFVPKFIVYQYIGEARAIANNPHTMFLILAIQKKH